MRALLVLLALGVALAPARASAQAATTPVDAIRAAALAGLGLAPGQGEAVVDRQLRLAVCTQPLIAAPRNARTAEVRCPDTPGWRLFVPVRVAGVRAVAAAPGVSGGGNVAPAAHQASAVPTHTASTPSSGALTDTAPLQAHVVPVDTAPTPAFTVRRGDPVVILARLGASEVRMAGRAMGSPGPGGTVAVQNTSSQRVLRGRLVGEGLVEVR